MDIPGRKVSSIWTTYLLDALDDTGGSHAMTLELEALFLERHGQTGVPSAGPCQSRVQIQGIRA